MTHLRQTINDTINLLKHMHELDVPITITHLLDEHHQRSIRMSGRNSVNDNINSIMSIRFNIHFSKPMDSKQLEAFENATELCLKMLSDLPYQNRIIILFFLELFRLLDKFDGRINFDLCQVQVKDVLIQSGLHKALKGKIFSKDSKNSESNKRDGDRKELDLIVANTIRLCLSKNVLANVQEISTTKELWKKLEGLY
ncbi:putative B3 domain-containing protein [Senna tora]|uniref:Putative B3 domain-containing protein n=1 Tax=Senna tora TaxID=362788 RepID=A0A834W7E1_9FABA|nr:putative B3 domain-containing protein [Senna tora]